MTRPKWLSLTYFDSLGKIVAGLTAIVVLITGIVSLVLLLLPKPLPKRKATLTGFQLVARESLRDFLAETGRPTRGYTKAQLRQFGNYYIVRVSVEGLRDRDPRIIWSVHRRNQGVNLQPAFWIHQPKPSNPPFDVPANSYFFTTQIWIQLPPVRGHFYALLEIDYPDYAPLAIALSKDFVVAKDQPAQTRTTTPVTQTYRNTTTTQPSSTTSTTIEQTTTGTLTTTTVPTDTTPTPSTTIETVTSKGPIVRPPAVTVAVP